MKPKKTGRIHIGISGWRYKGWRKIFYPPGLAQGRELEFAAKTFSSIELNGSFYSLQRPESYSRWYRETPDSFVFSIKGSRYITHMRRLRAVEIPLANFLASGLFHLGHKMGPFLWQFPPGFRYDAGLMENFFRLLPRTPREAAALARKRAPFMKGRCRLAVGKSGKLRHAVEIRHESFCTPSFVDLLRRHNVALVVADTAGRWPFREDVTADFVYIRLHGDKELYASGYTEESLDRWAKRIRAWSRGSESETGERISEKPPKKRASRDIYCYFDNDIKVRAPFDALRLSEKLGLKKS